MIAFAESSVYHVLLLCGLIVFLALGGLFYRTHPVIILLTGAILYGLASGVASKDVINLILSGFSTLVGAIGLILVFGTLLGVILEESGAVLSLGQFAANRFKGNAPLMFTVVAFITGIPVFCDSGFIILSRLAQVIARCSNIPTGTLSLSVGGALYTSHTLIPPTPGPVAAAGNFGMSAQLGWLVVIGLIIALPVLAVTWLYSRYVFIKFSGANSVNGQGYLINAAETRGPLWKPLFLLGLPLLCIALSSVADYIIVEQMYLLNLIKFAGNPTMALFVASLLGLWLFRDFKNQSEWISKAVQKAGSILVVTGCGGAVGAVIKASPVVTILQNWVTTLDSGIYVLGSAFLLSAIIKTAQGSTTSAMIIASSVMAGVIPNDFAAHTFHVALLIFAVGAGSMVISHANDSYFWVVSQYSGFNMRQAYAGISLLTFIQGITAFSSILVLYFFTSL